MINRQREILVKFGKPILRILGFLTVIIILFIFSLNQRYEIVTSPRLLKFDRWFNKTWIYNYQWNAWQEVGRTWIPPELLEEKKGFDPNQPFEVVPNP